MSNLLKYENYYWKLDNKYIAGIDEVGRGSLAGPVVSSCVILPNNKKILEKLSLVDDSKKLNSKLREKLFYIIINNCLDYSITFINSKIIDEINILQATFLSMKKCINKLKIVPDIILLDGNKKIPDIGIEQKTIVKGDSKSISIASASIIAKVCRDKFMIKIANKYPKYFFQKNKGYGTKEHIEQIKKNGLSDIHRITFCKNIIQEQLSLNIF
ncbi:MAG: ribonuclease HII [Candidatus Sericytochromatia bacterium]|nr:MAG: ribonuclease HII [Candidatus Sericytochromatia bacterium]